MTDAGITMMVTYNVSLVTLSVVIAIAVSFKPTNQLEVQPSYAMDNSLLGVGIGIATLVILTLALMTCYFYQRLNTEIARAEALQKAYDELEIRVEQRTNELRNAFEQLLVENTERKQVEETLRKSQQMLQSVMDNIPQFIFWKDKNSVYLGCNRNFAQLAGVGNLENIVGKTDYDLPWKKEEANFFRKYDRRVMDTGTPEYHIIESLLQANGKQACLDTNKVPLHDSRGNVVSVLGTFEDITDRKRAEEALRDAHQRLTFHVENSPLAAIEWDQDLRVLQWSPQAEKVFGWRAEEVLGKNTFDDSDFPFIHVEDKEAVRRNMVVPLMSGREQRKVWRNRSYTKSGSVVYCEWYNSVLLDESGKLVSVMSLAMDITERQRAEEALEKAHDELEIKVEERTTELSNANEQLRSEIVERKRAEEALQESHRQIINILERITDAFVALDHQWQFTYLNPQAEKLLQRKRGELLGKNVWEEYPEIFDQPFYRECQKVVSQQVAVTVEEFFPLLNIWFEIHAYPSKDGLTAYFNDITERKWEEKQVRLLQTIMQAITYAEDFHSALSVALREVCETTGWSFGEAWIPRLDGTVLECSPAWYASDFGDRHESPLQKFRRLSEAKTFPLGTGLPGQIWSSKQPEWLPDVSNQPENNFLRATIAQECGLKAGLGVPILDNEQVLAVLVFFTFKSREEDRRLLELVSAVAVELGAVIQRKRVEEEIKKLNEDLKCRTVELEAANKDLEAFSYSISHDLRAPLRAINGFSRILLKDYAPQLAPEAQRYLQMVQDNAQQMGHLVDGLLAFSRLGRSALKKQLVYPDELVRQALTDLRHEQENRHAEILIGDLPTCQADPLLLKQVWVNLLANALKFTRQEDVAKIEVSYEQINGDRVYFIKDNGVGFDMQYAHKLFSVFKRLHRAEEYEGTGVGLAIVQRIIHRHGGRVWANAEVNKGATFYFTVEGDIHYDSEGGRNPVSGRQPQRRGIDTPRLEK